jgi:hypothetical protein
MTHIENINKFDFDCNVGEYICQDSSVGEAISSSLNLDKNCTVYVNEVVCKERLNLGGDDADYVLKIPQSLGCKVIFDDVPIHVRINANNLEEKIECLHHPDSIHLAHCISKNAAMISNDKNLIKACNELSVPAFYLEDLLCGFYSLEKLRNLSHSSVTVNQKILSVNRKVLGAGAA